MTDTEIIDVESIDLDHYDPPAPLTLFGTRDPRVALERMADVAGALVDVIETKKLFVTIGGHRHITAEGWTTLGGMLGVVPIVTETRANDTGDGIVAHVEARTLDGRIVGAADGECSRVEHKWKDRDPYAIRSMAQTRAISRALRAPLGQIVVLAGHEPAAAEEIPADEPAPAAEPADKRRIPPNLRPDQEQRLELQRLVERLTELDPDTDWHAKRRELAGVPSDMVTRTVAALVLDQLRATLTALEGDES